MTGIIAAKQYLIDRLTGAADSARQSGKIPAVNLPDVAIERPQNSEHGDYASSYPLKLARAARTNPMAIARDLVSLMETEFQVADVEIAPPGFINFTFKTGWLTSQVEDILAKGEKYGNSLAGEGKRVQLEFVSANPTGPLHVGNGRGAILGSTLAKVLSAAGYEVKQEYYINDAGTQIHTFYRSLYARYQQVLNIDAEMPSDGYQGEYVTGLAGEIAAVKGDQFLKMPEALAIAKLGQIGLEKMLELIRSDLAMLRVEFDVWFSERSLYQGLYENVIGILRKGGYITEREGATWFVSTALGDDKDNVVVRGDGTPTYFASDIAYHYDKFVRREFDRVIDIWGADHQGHVSRMKAVVNALGIDPARLDVILYQLVTLCRGSEIVRLSKRSGDMITLREVIEEVGPDACRFFFLARSEDSQMDFDLELAKEQSQENPVYYVQYAHARIASILRLAQEKGIDYRDGDVNLLTSEPELTLIRKMLRLSEIIEIIVQTSEPHHLTYYAQDLATVFHSFYKQCRVITDDAALTGARLKLVKASEIVLAKALNLMGIEAPEKM
ncbi:MAG: arginine--tRNA ligase [Dehalococcoidales bacterium]|nr:arginine--tRNA ligase [Dehalococcoidales bacterium]